MEVPETVKRAPPSMESCTELMETESEAVPETLTVPETVAPLAGEVMATAGVGEATLIDRLFEAVSAEASLTCAEKVKEPAREGAPEIIPPELRVSPEGREPLSTLQE